MASAAILIFKTLVAHASQLRTAPPPVQAGEVEFFFVVDPHDLIWTVL
jgi:hypothetical protein